MNLDDIRIIKYNPDLSKRFGNWVFLQDRRPQSNGKKRRKEFIRYFETLFGEIGGRWQYANIDGSQYIIKLNDRQDLLLFLLKFKRS
jgi:hypothetical protein